MKILIDKMMFVLLGLIMLLLVVMAVWQVFTRFVLNNPSTFTEELLRYGLIWGGMLGAAYAFSGDKHLSLILVKDRLKGKKKQILLVFNEIVVWAFILSVYLYGGIQLVISNQGLSSSILRLPMSFVYAIIPLAGFFMILIKVDTYYGQLKQYRLKKGGKVL